jgi:prefoldin subunit 5
MEAHHENARLRANARRSAQLEQRLTTLTRRLSELEGQSARIAQLERSLQECEGIVRSYESSMLGRSGRALFHVRSRLR